MTGATHIALKDKMILMLTTINLASESMPQAQVLSITLFQLCLACYTALQVMNSTRYFSAVTTENAGSSWDSQQRGAIPGIDTLCCQQKEMGCEG